MSKIKICIISGVILLVSIVSALIGIHIYNDSKFDNSNIINSCFDVKGEQIVNGKKVKGAVFDYNMTIGMKDGKKKNYSGSEIYYLKNGELVSASEFMRG